MWNDPALAEAYVNRMYADNLPGWTTGDATTSDESPGGTDQLYGQATSSSVGSHGSTTQACSDLNIAILDIKTSCSQSYSTIDGGRPVSQNNAGVAEIDVALLPNVLGGLGLNSLLGSLGLGNLLGGTTTTAGSLPVVSQLPVGPLVDNLLNGLLKGVAGSAGVPLATNDIVSTLTNTLQQVLGNAGNLITIRLGSGSSVVSNNGSATQETTQAAGAHIGLIANLIQID